MVDYLSPLVSARARLCPLANLGRISGEQNGIRSAHDRGSAGLSTKPVTRATAFSQKLNEFHRTATRVTSTASCDRGPSLRGAISCIFSAASTSLVERIPAVGLASRSDFQ